MSREFQTLDREPFGALRVSKGIPGRRQRVSGPCSAADSQRASSSSWGFSDEQRRNQPDTGGSGGLRLSRTSFSRTTRGRECSGSFAHCLPTGQHPEASFRAAVSVVSGAGSHTPGSDRCGQCASPGRAGHSQCARQPCWRSPASSWASRRQGHARRTDRSPVHSVRLTTASTRIRRPPLEMRRGIFATDVATVCAV